MGWLWGSGDTSAAKDNLDPSLRDFLKNEAPTGSKPSLPSKPAKKTEPSAPAQTEDKSDPEVPSVPRESQFQDGRYAHLWKNYTPQNILEDRGKNEQDKLREIVDAYNDRKADIGRVAMENCAFEYMEQFDCFRNPKSWWSTATLCRDETKKFNRCYDVQSKFLKALGYLTIDDRSTEESEKIQMHADKLYQQMLAQEAAMEKAREEGKPIPKFESILSKKNVSRAMGAQSSNETSVPGNSKVDIDEDEIWSKIKPESRKEYEKKIAELPPHEQEFEKQALLGELKAQTSIAKKVEATFVEERINRMKRKEAGQTTIGDAIKRLWGWDK